MRYTKTSNQIAWPCTPLSCWKLLEDHYSDRGDIDISALNRKQGRYQHFSISFGDIFFDYSKTSLNERSMDLLFNLLEERQVTSRRDKMFEGTAINTSEKRAVLHTALRNFRNDELLVDGKDVMVGIRQCFQQMKTLCDRIHDGDLRTSTNEQFTDVVSIGIGGSDLGPMMATLALRPYNKNLKVHFVSNVDGAHISDTLQSLNPTRTLVIIASKTFTTTETMANARVARAWLHSAPVVDPTHHLVALSSAVDRAIDFGIIRERIFTFGDWVGGRFSVWGPIGLPLMLSIGTAHFEDFLHGAFEMDEHFRTASIDKNLPILSALVGVWHRNICGYGSRAVLPYDQRLQRLPAYLQQLDMESNGKSRDRSGNVVSRDTGPLVWGEPGTNGQHAFYQWLHQGTTIVPCEFLVAAEGHEPHLTTQQDLLLANCFAQSEALMNGRRIEGSHSTCSDASDAVAKQRNCDGNRPSVTLLYKKLDPKTLGRLLALFEHRVFVEGCIWGINSFDQWGVELGKELATALVPMIEGADTSSKDESTRGLLATTKSLRSSTGENPRHMLDHAVHDAIERDNVIGATQIN